MDEDKEIIKSQIQAANEAKDSKSSKKSKKAEQAKEAKPNQEQFPLRTFKPDLELTKLVKEFLIEYDFIVLMTLITTFTFTTSQILKFFVPEEVTSNFLYYAMIIILILSMYYLIKQNTYPFEFSDENKILLTFAFKTFILSYMILGYFGNYFDFKVEQGVKELQLRTDQILKVVGARYIYSYDTFYIGLSFLASLQSLTIVHIGIKYSYNFFYLNKQNPTSDEEDDPQVTRQVSIYKTMMAVNFFTPIFAIFLFIPALSKSLVVPDAMSERSFELARTIILMLIIILKASMFFYELQFNFNESYFFIQSLLKNKSEKLFDYITLKIRLKLINTWITCFQY